ncbi:hypothetical protein L1987_59071 [Smallanthus sonchifolius]|uniref:Uncharacterized protein n=1 Tax=Smallanthus sonchifolius TaxID=185202 RepID=A0ACB9D478_9ASTR|nr:hypothetical protein L1987_59071 [Smallanthus sonchifolius]
MSEEDASKIKNKRISQAKNLSDLPDFSLVDPVMMLPADELFFDGEFVPQQFSIRQEVATSTTIILPGVRSPDTPYSRQRIEDAFSADPGSFELAKTERYRWGRRMKNAIGIWKF